MFTIRNLRIMKTVRLIALALISITSLQLKAQNTTPDVEELLNVIGVSLEKVQKNMATEALQLSDVEIVFQSILQDNGSQVIYKTYPGNEPLMEHAVQLMEFEFEMKSPTQKDIPVLETAFEKALRDAWFTASKKGKDYGTMAFDECEVQLKFQVIEGAQMGGSLNSTSLMPIVHPGQPDTPYHWIVLVFETEDDED